MQSSLRRVKRAVRGNALCCVAVLCGLSLQAPGQIRTTAGNPVLSSGAVSLDHDPLSDAAFDRFYNLEYDRAIQGFEKVVEQRRNDPSAVNHLMSAVLMRELYRMGAMNTGEYANDSFVGEAHRAADPARKQRIKQLVEQAEKLEDAELARNPKNVDMLYARGVTRGQFALYTALIERAWFSSLRNAVGARRDHERVLELAPQYTDAKLIV